jgi:predicted transcriptional regulator
MKVRLIAIPAGRGLHFRVDTEGLHLPDDPLTLNQLLTPARVLAAESALHETLRSAHDALQRASQAEHQLKAATTLLERTSLIDGALIEHNREFKQACRSLAEKYFVTAEELKKAIIQHTADIRESLIQRTADILEVTIAQSQILNSEISSLGTDLSQTLASHHEKLWALSLKLDRIHEDTTGRGLSLTSEIESLQSQLSKGLASNHEQLGILAQTIDRIREDATERERSLRGEHQAALVRLEQQRIEKIKEHQVVREQEMNEIHLAYRSSRWWRLGILVRPIFGRPHRLETHPLQSSTAELP